MKHDLRTLRTKNTDDIIWGMAEGNIHARIILRDIIHECKKGDPWIDPDGQSFISILDKIKVYGHRIDAFYIKVCSRDLSRVLLVLEANKQNINEASSQKIAEAIDSGRKLDFRKIVSKTSESWALTHFRR